MCITKRYKLKILQIYAPMKSYSEETQITSTTTSMTLLKPHQLTLLMGEFNAQNVKRQKSYGHGNGSNWEMKEDTSWLNGQHQKVQLNQNHAPKGFRDDMVKKKPKQYSEWRHWPSKQATHRHIIKNHTACQHWKLQQLWATSNLTESWKVQIDDQYDHHEYMPHK